MKMKPFIKMTFPIVLFSFFSVAINFPFAGYTEESKVETAIEVLAEIMKIPETSIPTSLLKNTYAIAVFPGVIKAGFVVGGRGGRGILIIRTEENVWSNPTFVTIAGASVGFQLGAQSSDVILVFKNRRSIDGIIKGKFTLGADASVAAGPVGRQAQAGTDIQFSAEILSYSRSRGLFAGVSLEGSALQIDDEYNRGFYENENITAEEILTNRNIVAPAVAERFKKELSKYTSMEKK